MGRGLHGSQLLGRFHAVLERDIQHSFYKKPRDRLFIFFLSVLNSVGTETSRCIEFHSPINVQRTCFSRCMVLGGRNNLQFHMRDCRIASPLPLLHARYLPLSVRSNDKCFQKGRALSGVFRICKDKIVTTCRSDSRPSETVNSLIDQETQIRSSSSCISWGRVSCRLPPT